MQKYPEELQYICKRGKVKEEERIWKSKYKATVTELKELKDRYKEMVKKRHTEEICQHKRCIFAD